jgi:hypothetical protein
LGDNHGKEGIGIGGERRPKDRVKRGFTLGDDSIILGPRNYVIRRRYP